MVKRLCLRPVAQLEPMGPNYQSIPLHDGAGDLDIVSVVVSTITRLKQYPR